VWNFRWLCKNSSFNSSLRHSKALGVSNIKHFCKCEILFFYVILKLVEFVVLHGGGFAIWFQCESGVVAPGFFNI
jgi:hypothetical protein